MRCQRPWPLAVRLYTPHPDAKARMARFLRNAILAAGAYPWTVVRAKDRGLARRVRSRQHRCAESLFQERTQRI